jgi:ankyrin repeat protein
MDAVGARAPEPVVPTSRGTLGALYPGLAPASAGTDADALPTLESHDEESIDRFVRTTDLRGSERAKAVRRRFLDLGQDIARLTEAGDDGSTLLHVVCAQSDAETLHTLLSLVENFDPGADASTRETWLNRQNGEGDTALVALLKTALGETAPRGETPSGSGGAARFERMARALLGGLAAGGLRGADDANADDANAVAGADPRLANARGETALMYASAAGLVDAARAIAAAHLALAFREQAARCATEPAPGCLLRGRHGRAARRRAADEAREVMATAADADGWTALLLAARWSRPRVAALLRWDLALDAGRGSRVRAVDAARDVRPPETLDTSGATHALTGAGGRALPLDGVSAQHQALMEAERARRGDGDSPDGDSPDGNSPADPETSPGGGGPANSADAGIWVDVEDSPRSTDGLRDRVWSAQTLAAFLGDVPVLRALLSDRVDRMAPHARDVNCEDETALTWAVRGGHIEAVKWLVGHKAVYVLDETMAGERPPALAKRLLEQCKDAGTPTIADAPGGHPQHAWTGCPPETLRARQAVARYLKRYRRLSVRGVVSTLMAFTGAAHEAPALIGNIDGVSYSERMGGTQHRNAFRSHDLFWRRQRTEQGGAGAFRRGVVDKPDQVDGDDFACIGPIKYGIVRRSDKEAMLRWIEGEGELPDGAVPMEGGGGAEAGSGSLLRPDPPPGPPPEGIVRDRRRGSKAGLASGEPQRTDV